MKLVLSLMLLAVTTTAFAAKIDYSYCSKFIEDANQNFTKTNFTYPFTVDPKTGELKTTNHQMNFKVEGNNRIYNREGQDGQGMYYKIKIIATEGEKNKIDKIVVKTRRNNRVNTDTTIDFKVKNGKCYPFKGSNVIKTPRDMILNTLFDTKLCRDIQKFFKKHKKIKACFDQTSKPSKKMLKLFKDSGYDVDKISPRYVNYTATRGRYTDTIEQKLASASLNALNPHGIYDKKTNKNLMGIVGGSPLISGHMILSDCYDRGLAKLMSDNELWNAPVVEELPIPVTTTVEVE